MLSKVNESICLKLSLSRCKFYCFLKENNHFDASLLSIEIFLKKSYTVIRICPYEVADFCSDSIEFFILLIFITNSSDSQIVLKFNYTRKKIRIIEPSLIIKTKQVRYFGLVTIKIRSLNVFPLRVLSKRC